MLHTELTRARILVGLPPATVAARARLAGVLALSELGVATLGDGRGGQTHVGLLFGDQSVELLLTVQEPGCGGGLLFRLDHFRIGVPVVVSFFASEVEPQAAEVVFVQDVDLAEVQRVPEDLFCGYVLTAVAVDQHSAAVERSEDHSRSEMHGIFDSVAQFDLLLFVGCGKELP